MKKEKILINAYGKSKEKHFVEIAKSDEVTLIYTTANAQKTLENLTGKNVLNILLLDADNEHYKEINLKTVRNSNENQVKVITETNIYLFAAYDIRWWREHLTRLLDNAQFKSVINIVEEVKEVEETIVQSTTKSETKDYNWFKFDESTKLEEQVKYNIAVNVEAYCNVHYDNHGTDKLTVEELTDYVYAEVYANYNVAGKSWQDNRLRYYGKNAIMQLVKEYIENYSDVQDFIKRKDKILQLQPTRAEHANEKKLKEMFK